MIALASPRLAAALVVWLVLVLTWSLLCHARHVRRRRAAVLQEFLRPTSDERWAGGR